MNWDELDTEVRGLGSKITGEFDVIIGIARGGVVPSVILAKMLKVKDLYVLKIRREGEERRVMAEILPDVAGMRVLLVEDMLETGKSMIVGKQYLESKGAIVTTLCLYTMPQTEIVPDYFVREVSEVQKFPWE